MEKLRKHWTEQYDWRVCESLLNGFGQFKTEIDGLPIHFLHVRSQEPDALPLLLTHGWPGSVLEFRKVIEPLVDPVKYGGSARDAFDVIVASLPGFGFSGQPKEAGWNANLLDLRETSIEQSQPLVPERTFAVVDQGIHRYLALGGSDHFEPKASLRAEQRHAVETILGSQYFAINLAACERSRVVDRKHQCFSCKASLANQSGNLNSSETSKLIYSEFS